MTSVHALIQDARYAIRILLRAPAFTLVAVLTLAVGIGANIAMFSVVYGVLLRPLPYRDADRLVIVRAEQDLVGASRPVPILVPWNELTNVQRPLDAVAATAFYASDVVALSGDNGSEVLDSAIVSGNFFAVMAGPFRAGRPLGDADGGSAAAVISERLARRLFAGAERAVGAPIVLTRRSYVVVGVASREFQFPSANVDVWLPAGFMHAANPRCCSFQVVAKLDETGTPDRAGAAFHSVFQASFGGQGATRIDIRTTAVRLPDELVSAVRPALLVLFASVLMVLGVACGNLVNLVLARNAGREQEFAVRRALGASASSLVRQLLVEGAVLGVVGAAAGAVLARLSLPVLSRFAGDALPRIDAIQIDKPAVLFASVVATLVTIVTGITPVLRVLRAPATATRGIDRTATPARARRLQRGLCVVQIALAVVLLIGATLMGRSLTRLLHVDLGVTTDHVLTASLNLAFGERPPDAQVLARINRVIEDLRQLPGVRAAGVGTSIPPSLGRIRVTLRRAGDVVDYQAAAVPATPGYFSALQMRLIEGRFFTDADDEQHPPVMIMSEATAKRFFGADDPIGRTMTLPVLRDGVRTSAEMTLVGVTANVKYAGLAAAPDDVVYRPFAQQPWVAPFVVIRTSGDPADLALPLRRRLAALDRGIVVSSVTTLDQLVLDAAAQPQFRTALLASLAGLAIGIAAMGLYGVVAYAVSRRTREIGIRIALGATSREVLAMVVRDGMLLAVIGIVLGVAGAFFLAKLLTRLLYGITPTDPVSFALASAGLLALALVATYVPARRAARIEPLRALRTE
jgi:putative ABC transport system permease protein